MDARVIEDYVKVVYNSREWSDTPITTGGIATRLNLAPSTVSEAVRKLVDLGLVSHEPYGAVSLTAQGERQALTVVRKHRLIETFLVDFLGYSWDQVHDEAEILEHAASDTFIARLDERLGYPTVDPHGDPIPGADGTVPIPLTVPVAQAPVGVEVRVDRVNDGDPEILRQLRSLGISIGATLTIISRADDHIETSIGQGKHAVILPASAIDAIRVSRVRAT